jgi:hypothetical protein
MKDWTWPVAVVIVSIILSLTTMFAMTTDPELEQEILNHFITVLTFVIAALGGAGIGYARALIRTRSP